MILAAMVFVALAVAAAVLCSPVVLVVDSARAQVQVRWLFAIAYQRPLPGAEGETRLSIAGHTVPLRRRKPKRKRAKLAARRARRRKAARGRFFYRCLRNRAIRRRLFRQLGRLRRGVFRTVEMKRRRVRVSFPDPALTGMLYGITQFGWARWAGIEPNFTGENSVFLEIRLRPHRIVKPVFSFLTGLPYRAMFKEWRASSARAPAQ
jgi:hypothetical protein